MTYYQTGFTGNSGPGAPASSKFNLNPTPQTGVLSPFGAVPGPLGLPNPSADLSAVYPNLSGTNATLSGDISSQLSGELSPGTLRQMQDYEAQFAAGSGMPGTNARPGTLMYNRGVRDIGSTAEAQVRAGEQAYNPAVSTISGTQTVTPALQSEIAGTNALNASAPSPTVAQSYAKQLFDQYMSSMRGPGGGTSGSRNSSMFPPVPNRDMRWFYQNPTGGGSGSSSSASDGWYDPGQGGYSSVDDYLGQALSDEGAPTYAGGF